MKITAIRSDKIYEKMISAKLGERDDIYRYELMNHLSLSGHALVFRLNQKNQMVMMLLWQVVWVADFFAFFNKT